MIIFHLFLNLVYLFQADFLLLYSLFWKSDDGKPSCDFTNQKVWILIWQVCNVMAILGLTVALGKYASMYKTTKLYIFTSWQVGICGLGSGQCFMFLFILLSSSSSSLSSPSSATPPSSSLHFIDTSKRHISM